MVNQNFTNISKEECLIFYKRILENSDKKWVTTRRLSAAQDYGTAISTSIISIEELIKAILVFLDGKGFKFRTVNGINTFFKNHEIRFVIAYFMFIIMLLGDELKAFILRIGKDNEVARQISEALKHKSNWIEKNKRFIFRKFIIFKSELNWFSQVEIFRQEGFYSDYNGSLKSPVEITQEEFLQVYERLRRVRELGKSFIKSIEKNDDSIINHFLKLQDDFDSKEFYLKIGEGLAFLRSTKQKPFLFLIGKLNNFLANRDRA